MSTLYDAQGRPISTKELREEIAGPSVAGVRSVLSGHPAQGLTPERLASLLIAAEQGDEQAYLELAEEMEEKDLHYRSVLATRKIQVSGLEMTVEAASEDKADVRAADAVRDFLDVVRPALFDILDAVGKGFSVSEIIWDTEGSMWLPARIEWRDPRWFGFDPNTGRGPLLRDDAGNLVELAPAKFVLHHCKSKSGLPIRGGLARAASWAWLFKNFDLKAWVIFCEVYGHPLRVGKYGEGATESDKAVLLRAVRNISADHAAIVPDSMVLEFIDAKAQGNAVVFEALAEYLDRQMSKLVLGQTGTTDTGSRVGTANAHERVRADIERSDASQLSATLNRDLVAPFMRLNFADTARAPQIRIFRPDEEDLNGMVDRLVKVLPYAPNLVEVSVIRDKLGFPEPAPGAACLGDQREPDQNAQIGAAPEPETPGADPERPRVGRRGLKATDTARAAQSVSLMPSEGDAPETAAPDWIDDLSAEALEARGGWMPLAASLTDPVAELAARCETFADFAAGLAALAGTLSPQALAEALARYGFAARVMAAHGAAPEPPARDDHA